MSRYSAIGPSAPTTPKPMVRGRWRDPNRWSSLPLVADLFAVGEERIAAASGAKQFHVTVGLPWTATIALGCDLPNKV
jgi:hypothetical protein